MSAIHDAETLISSSLPSQSSAALDSSAGDSKSSRASDALRGLAAPLRLMFWCLAGLTLLDRLIQPSIYLQDPRAWLRLVLAIGGGVASLLGFAALVLAGWIAERLMMFWADRIDDRADWEARLLQRWEFQAAPFQRPFEAPIAQAEVAPSVSASSLNAVAVAAESPPAVSRFEPIRRALAARNVIEALELARGFETEAEAPEDGEASAMLERVERLRSEVVAEIKAKVAAAKEARDPDQILAYREELAPLLPSDDKRELDQNLLRWLMKLFQNKLRGGVINEDLATLAARIADAFAEYPDGASMRAGLPTLRRSAGLCPRCAEPYRGIENACPQCMAAEAAKKAAARIAAASESRSE